MLPKMKIIIMHFVTPLDALFLISIWHYSCKHSPANSSGMKNITVPQQTVRRLKNKKDAGDLLCIFPYQLQRASSAITTKLSAL